MGPYSHYTLALKLEPFLLPADPQAFAWGSVAPDIRYLANMRRDQTHLSLDRIQEFAKRYPDLYSFLSGYQVHLLIDQVDVSKIVNRAFPLNLFTKVLRKSIPPNQMTMMVEMSYLQSSAAGKPLSGDYNAVLANLSITPEQTRIYQQALQEYFENRTAEAAISAFQRIGWIQNTRVEKYLDAYHTMQKRKMLKALIMLTIKNVRLDARVIRHIRSNIGENFPKKEEMVQPMDTEKNG